MKKIITLLLIFTGFVFAADEAETLISGQVTSGGYGSFNMGLGEFNGETGLVLGGQGGWVVNKTFVLGGGGCGLVTEVPKPGSDSLYMNMGYGGVLLEYIINSNKLLHVKVSGLVGGGGVSFSERNYDGRDMENLDTEGFFVFEPGVQLVLNVTRNFRIAAGGTYRMVNGISEDFVGTSDDELTGPNMKVSFMFGAF